MLELSDLLAKIRDGEDADRCDKVVLAGKLMKYEVCKYLKTTNGVEYYCCRGEDGLWRMLGVAETHRYNGTVKELAHKLKEISKRSRKAEQDYREAVIIDEMGKLDYDMVDVIEARIQLDKDKARGGRIDEDLLDELSDQSESSENARFYWMASQRHYDWLFSRVIECWTAPELNGRRVIVMEPQDIDLRKTVSLEEVLEKQAKLDTIDVVWILDWLCRVVDFLFISGMILEVTLDNVYVELPAQRLFLLDWSRTFTLDYKSRYHYRCRRENGDAVPYRRGADHFLMNIVMISKIGLEMLGGERDEESGWIVMMDKEKAAQMGTQRSKLFDFLYELYVMNPKNFQPLYDLMCGRRLHDYYWDMEGDWQKTLTGRHLEGYFWTSMERIFLDLIYDSDDGVIKFRPLES